MRLALIAIATAIFFHSSGWASEKTVLSGQQLAACLVAVAEYERFAQRAATEHRTVVVSDLAEGIEVAFVPYGPNDKITTLGGTSEYGDGIQYLISRDTFEVLRVTFSR
jgi:hypothetical protein